MTKQQKDEITEDELLIYGAYGRIAYSLRHSNYVQLTYKFIMFTWLMANFIGIGYIISSEEINLPIHPFLFVPVICLASLLVVGIVWHLDLIVEEKKIASIAHKGVKIEEKHPEILPRAYQNCVALQYFLGYVLLKTLFYLGWASILILTMTVSISAYLYIMKSNLWILALFLPFIVIPILFFVARLITKRTNPYIILDRIHSEKELWK